MSDDTNHAAATIMGAIVTAFLVFLALGIRQAAGWPWLNDWFIAAGALASFVGFSSWIFHVANKRKW